MENRNSSIAFSQNWLQHGKRKNGIRFQPKQADETIEKVMGGYTFSLVVGIE